MNKGVTLFFLLLLKINSFCQVYNIDSICNSFDQYRISHFQEKLFVHTDRDSYLAGEIIWFKVYNVDATFHRPLNISSVAYIELLDKDNRPVLQSKVRLAEGKGHGSLYLPISLSSGIYRLRVYTRWMKNFSPEFYFEKNIRVINTLKAGFSTSLPAKKYDVQFFPEGGHLVAGLKSRVGFRVTDNDGNGADITGVIIDNENKIAGDLHVLKFGMGSFLFTPQAGRDYRALINLPDGKKLTQKLPQVSDHGYVMSLTEADDEKLRINIESGKTSLGNVFLFVHSRNSITVALKAVLSDGHAEFILQKNILKDGISHFTVFDTERRPVTERLYFKKPSKKLSLVINSDKKQYGLREKVKVDISAMFNSKPVNADLSLSVFHADSLQMNDSGTDIQSYLLLSSDLAGTVQDPGYYFSGEGPEVSEALDNLMLTQGWRRFRWDEVFESKKPVLEFLPEVNGHIISAKVSSSATGVSVPKVPVFFSAVGKRVQFYNSESDFNGTASFYTKNFYEQNEVILQTDIKDSLLRTVIINPYSGKYSSRPIQNLEIPFSLTNTLVRNSINMQALNVYYKDKLRQHTTFLNTDTLPFYGKPDERYLLDNYTRFPTMEEVLREYITGVGIRRKAGKLTMQIYTDEVNKSFFDEAPLILFDGTPVFNTDKIFSYDPLKVKSIEVVTKHYFYGRSIYGGIVNFTTYNGNLDNFEIDSRAAVLDYEGLQQQREFYSPIYDTPEKTAGRLPDFRNLLFWSPEIKTDKEGKAVLGFYTSDRPGIYKGIIQGLSGDGQAGKQIFSFEIK